METKFDDTNYEDILRELFHDDERFYIYAANLRKIPDKDDKLYNQYLLDLKLANDNSYTFEPKTQTQVPKPLPTEITYIKARKAWTDAVSRFQQLNEIYKAKMKIKIKIFNRFKDFGYTHGIDNIYNDCIDYLQNNSVIVLTFNASFLIKGLTDYQPLNVFERLNKNFLYNQKRESVEKRLFQPLDQELRSAVLDNIHARPCYAAFVLLDKNHSIQATFGYGTSYIVLHDIVKYNSLYNSNDSFGRNYRPCSYHDMDLILLECGNDLFKALLQRVTKGALTRYRGYVEANDPPY